MIKAVRDYFDSHGFTLVDTPIFTARRVRGTTTLFEVNYFDDDKAYLTPSPGSSATKQNAMAFRKVYCFGPTFRTRRNQRRAGISRSSGWWSLRRWPMRISTKIEKRVAER